MTQSIVKEHRASARYGKDVGYALICEKIGYYVSYRLHLIPPRKA